jgi:DNA-binding NarL/FixJ family response regulator
MAVRTRVELIGREGEHERLRRFVADLVAGPGALLLHGDAGIGKTALWRAAVEEAEAAGAKVLVTRCVEAEMPIAFGGLADLLGESLPDVAAELSEPQRAALAAAVGLEAPHDTSPDRIVLPRAFTTALRVLAGRAPVLIAVDDVQWLDPPSRRVLAFAIRRLTEAPVGVLLTQRGAGTGSSLDLLQGVDEQVEEMRLGPLGVDAVHQLVRSRLGVRMPRLALTRVHQASGGNPMFALELARTAAGKKSDVAGPLPNPLSLEELVRDRVLEYSNGIRPLLEVVAAVERATPALLARTVDDADELLDAAIAAGAVTLGDDAVVRFAHPLLTAAIYAELPPARRRALHARIAAATPEPEERARQLALSSAEPDANVARLLDAVAAHARARGAPETAAELARQAVRLTSPEDGVDRDQRVLTVAGYLADAGQFADAAACLDQLLAGGLSGPARSQACLLRFHVESDIEVRGHLAAEAVEHAGDDPGLCARALLLASKYRLNREEFDESDALAQQALAEAERAGEPALVATALGAVATVRTFLRTSAEPALFERAIALADEYGVLPRTTPPRVLLAEQLRKEGDLRRARELFVTARDATSGSQHERVVMGLAEIELDAGNWELAERHLDQAWELAFDGGDRFVEGWVRLRRTYLAALRGHADEARELARECIAHGEAVHWPFVAADTRSTLGFLELSLGDPGRAWELLADGTGKSDVPFEPTIADAVEALCGLGRLDDARELLARFEQQEQRGIWAAPGALRCRALLLLAAGDAETACVAAAESAAGFEAAGFPLDQGRALLVAGEALRRLGERRRAAEPLEVAGTIFAGLGATLWLERVEQELRRARPRPRRDRGLTGAERRVASLVAEGRMNREVAAQLFTTVGTVEAHLTRIYRKLDVRTRTELARGVAEGTLDLEER